MARSTLLVGLVLGLVVAVGCEPASSLTPGNQRVQVVATAASVSVNPSTVHPGQVDFILELPNGQSLVFIRSATGGALTDADLSRLAQNVDAEGLASEVMDVSCCGNVFHETLAAGKYAFIVLDPRRGQPGLPPAAMTVVNVQG